jgi:hypothetical protein
MHTNSLPTAIVFPSYSPTISIYPTANIFTITNKDGRVIYDGKYSLKDDKKIDIGKEYDLNGNIVFEGEYRCGYRYNSKLDQNNKHISFKESSDGIEFEGVYENGERKGVVRYYTKGVFSKKIEKKEVDVICGSAWTLTKVLTSLKKPFLTNLEDLNNNKQKIL